MTMLYCLVHDHVFSDRKTDRKELGFYGSVAEADAARAQVMTRPGFDEQSDNFAIVPFRLDDEDGDEPVPAVFFGLFFELEVPQRDAAGELLYYTDIEKTVGVYSTAVKAAEALVRRLNEPEYADHPSSFRIFRHALGVTGWETGYFTA